MGNMKDITCKKFGKWTVIGVSGKTPYGAYTWDCICECGTRRSVVGHTLRHGMSKGCGCGNGKNNMSGYKHGGKKERLYAVWGSMKSRCLNKNEPFYPRYGGRGITICDEWKDYAKFREWALSSGYDPNSEYRKCTLDRIDNDKGYCPENCRWMTQKEQSNNRSSNHFLTNSSGVTKTISQWAEETGIPKHTIRNRVCKSGWTVDRALTEPVRRSGRTQST